MNKKLNDRLYSWEVIIYQTPDIVEGVIQCYSEVSNYLIVYHDKDQKKNDNDEIEFKLAHCHCYLTFKRALSRKKIADDLSFWAAQTEGDTPLFTVVKENIDTIKGSLSDCADYALHKFETDPLQHHYSKDDLISSNLKLFLKSRSDSDERGFSVIQDMELGFSLRELAIKYGRDFIIHYKQYKEFYEDMIFQDRFGNKLKLVDDSISHEDPFGIQEEIYIDNNKAHRIRST